MDVEFIEAAIAKDVKLLQPHRMRIEMSMDLRRRRVSNIATRVAVLGSK